MIDNVIAVSAALARLHKRRGIEVGDAERLQIGDDGSGRVEIEVRRELHAVGCDRNGPWHYCVSRRQNTDQGAIRSLVSPPQIGVPVASLRLWTISRFDRLAVSSSVAPSPMRQLAVSKRSSAACASPKAAPASRGTISRRRIASNCCTSASRFFPAGWLRDCQSSIAD